MTSASRGRRRGPRDDADAGWPERPGGHGSSDLRGIGRRRDGSARIPRRMPRAIATMGAATPIGADCPPRPEVHRARPDPPRLAASGRPPQARHPARRDRPSRRSSARSSASCPGCSATRRWPTSRVRPLEIRTPIEPMTAHELAERIGLRADPAGRPRHGRRDARADADRAGLAPRAVPRRADAPAGRVLQQAARLRDRGPVPDPRPDARDRRLGDGRDRGPQEVGRGPDQAGQPDRRARGRRGRHRRPTRTSTSTARRWTARSTTRATSSRASATPATASSGRAARSSGGLLR